MPIRKWLGGLLGYCLATVVVWLLAMPAARADTFQVNNTNDSGPGSLPQAVIDANNDINTADTIAFADTVSGTINLTTGAMTISGPVIIDGPGPDVLTIDAQQASSIFVVNADTGVPVTIRGLSLTNGKSATGVLGGAILVNGGDLSLENCHLFNNEAVEESGGAIAFVQETSGHISDSVFEENIADDSGGAIFFRGHGILEIVNSQITNNTATGETLDGNGGGIFHEAMDPFEQFLFTLRNSSVNGNSAKQIGGGLYLQAQFQTSMLIDHSQIDNNQAEEGGGLLIEAEPDPDTGEIFPQLVILYSEILGNNACEEGGGLFSAETDILVTNSTISNNAAGVPLPTALNPDADEPSECEGFYGGVLAELGVINLVNSTVSGNQAKADGGGMFFDEDVTVGLFNVTVFGNAADSDGDGNGAAGGIVLSELGGSLITMENSILAGNTDSVGSSDCFGPIFSTGYNLLGNNAGCQFAESVGDLVGTPDAPINPELDSVLQNNGGATPTLALLTGSPAIDAGNPDGCMFMDANGNLVNLPIDQRDVTRPQGKRCDIGAYELEQQQTEDGGGQSGSGTSGAFSGGGCSLISAREHPAGETATMLVLAGLLMLIYVGARRRAKSIKF